MKRITCTFDNGPHAQGTPYVLDALAERGLRSTFFLVAERLRDPALRALARRARSEGHRIANHTLSHGVTLGKRPGQEAVREIGEAQTLLGDLADTLLFRPNGDKGQLGPHLLSQAAVDYLMAERYTAVHWNCVPRDWEAPDGSWVDRAERALERQDWTVLVLHDHCMAGSRHLGPFLDRLIASGCEFRDDYPPECVMLKEGTPQPALEGMVS